LQPMDRKKGSSKEAKSYASSGRLPEGGSAERGVPPSIRERPVFTCFRGSKKRGGQKLYHKKPEEEKNCNKNP